MIGSLNFHVTSGRSLPVVCECNYVHIDSGGAILLSALHFREALLVYFQFLKTSGDDYFFKDTFNTLYTQVHIDGDFDQYTPSYICYLKRLYY